MKRIAGRGRSPRGVLFGGTQTLWMGPDHLLVVTDRGYSEEYKRFYFKDIQALMIWRTLTSTVSRAVFGFLAVAGLALTAACLWRGWHGAWVLCWAGISGFFLLCLLADWARSPTCGCALQTAVQTERLYAVHRLRQATRFWARFSDAVETVQDALDEEQLARWGPAPAP